MFTFELSALPKKANGLAVTKRSTLKIAAGMYDPLAILSPVLVSVKVLLQCQLLSLPEEVRNDDEESETGFLRRFKYLPRLKMFGMVEKGISSRIKRASL